MGYSSCSPFKWITPPTPVLLLTFRGGPVAALREVEDGWGEEGRGQGWGGNGTGAGVGRSLRTCESGMQRGCWPDLKHGTANGASTAAHSKSEWPHQDTTEQLKGHGTSSTSAPTGGCCCSGQPPRLHTPGDPHGLLRSIGRRQRRVTVQQEADENNPFYELIQIGCRFVQAAATTCQRGRNQRTEIGCRLVQQRSSLKTPPTLLAVFV